MRLKKYYDSIRTNKPFLKASVNQKFKIINNISKFFKSHSRKSLILNNKPVTAQIEPTSVCNLGCSFCVRTKTGVPIGTMSFNNFKKILKKLDGLYKVHLSGQGEPFLNKDIFKMIKYANEKGILVTTTTNGTMLTKNVIDQICQFDIGEIQVSFESTKKEKYNELRKGANFDDVMSKVKNFTSELKKRNKKTIVSFSITILKDNIDEIPDFLNLARETGVKKMIFQTIQNKDDYLERYDSKTKSQTVVNFVDELQRKIIEIQKLAKKDKILIIFDEQKSMGGCMWPWRGIYVTWNGYITPCCKTLNYNDPDMGNLLKQDFWKIWNNKNYQMYREMLRKREAPLKCVGCNMV